MVTDRIARRLPLDVIIIGAGNMARGIGYRLAAGGHSLTFVDRTPTKAEALAEEIRKSKAGAKVTTTPMGSALAAPVVVLALPFDAARDFATSHADKLAGKVVVDITNPLNVTYDGLSVAAGTSAAEVIAAALPKSRVVKAFNTTFAGPLANGSAGGEKLDVLVAGDDADAKATVIGLVRDGGLTGIDAGKLDRARQLEGLALLGITLQGPLGLGFQSAWKLVA